MKTLRPYMVWMGDDPHEGAWLVFAHDAKEARKLGFIECSQCFDGGWIDCRVKMLKGEHLFAAANPEKLHWNESHVGNPWVCPNCETWGSEPVKGGCGFCAENEHEDH